MESVTVSVHEDTLTKIKGVKKNPGEALNTILDDYISAGSEINIGRVAAAVVAHIQHPVVSEAPIKRTTIYMDPRRMKALRQYAQKTHFTFDGLLRIIVQDWFVQHEDAMQP